MDDDNDKQRHEVALFRFGVISELVSSRLEPGDLTDLIYHKSEQRWDIPGSDRTRISAATIRRWLRLYERSGRDLASLAPAKRCDRGRSRRVDEETGDVHVSTASGMAQIRLLSFRNTVARRFSAESGRGFVIGALCAWLDSSKGGWFGWFGCSSRAKAAR